MIQTIIVFLIVGLAVAWTARNLYRSFKGDTGCSCSCSGCAEISGCQAHNACEIPEAPKDAQEEDR